MLRISEGFIHLRVHFCLIFSLTVFLCSCNNDQTKPSGTARIALPKSAAAEGMWDMLGFHPGNKIPDFILYSSNGERFRLYDELGKGKPVVLVNGSYTCDISRGNLPSIKNLAQRHDSVVNVVMVYTIEAHPNDTLSPYATNTDDWIPVNNIRDNISASQPKTYAERVELASLWIRENEISIPVVIDGPENEYWMAFGQAPNMCYIIDPDGIVTYRQTWYNEKKLDGEILSLIQ